MMLRPWDPVEVAGAMGKPLVVLRAGRTALGSYQAGGLIGVLNAAVRKGAFRCI
jgi:hypothetical protein